MPAGVGPDVATLFYGWQPAWIEADLRAAGIPWREDSTNAAPRYVRSRIEREKNEIQLFMQQVTDRLLELDKHIQEDAALRDSIFEENNIIYLKGLINLVQITLDESI